MHHVLFSIPYPHCQVREDEDVDSTLKNVFPFKAKDMLKALEDIIAGLDEEHGPEPESHTENGQQSVKDESLEAEKTNNDVIDEKQED